METDKSHLFGRLAVEAGYITQADLDRCLSLQQDKTGTRLGAILVEQGLITFDQVHALISEQTERLFGGETLEIDPEGGLFGTLLIEHGYVEAPQVEQILEEQAKLLRLKIRMRLGEILVSRGILSPSQVREVLELQRKTILMCPSCKVRYNVADLEVGVNLRCTACDVRLTPEGTSVAVKETIRIDRRK